MPRPYTFTRYADHQVAPKEAVNDLQAAIEALDSGGTSFTAYGGTTALPGETTVAAPTGVAATDTANIASAISTAGAGGVLRFRPGTYLTTGLTANQADQTWLLPPTCILKGAAGIGATPVLNLTADRVTLDGGQVDATLGTGEGDVVRATGTLTSQIGTVGATVTAGDKTITLTATVSASIVAGDVLLLRSHYEIFSTDTPSLDKKSEFVTVASKAGAVITLVGPVRDTYTFSATAGNETYIDRLVLLDRPTVRNMRLTGAGVTQSQHAFHFLHTRTPTMSNLTVYDCGRSAFDIENAIGGFIENGVAWRIKNNQAVGSNYAYSHVLAGAEGLTVIGGEAFLCRTGYDVSGHSESHQSVSRNNSFIACHATDIDSSAFDTHGAAEDTSYSACHAIRCFQGFGARGYRTTFYDCHVRGLTPNPDGGTFGYGLAFGYGNGGKGLRWIGGSMDCRLNSGEAGTRGIAIDGDIVDDVLIDGVTVYNFSQNGIEWYSGASPKTMRNFRLINSHIDASLVSGATPIKLVPTLTDGSNIIDVEIAHNTLIARPSGTAIIIAGNGASGANVSKRIRITDNRAPNATTFAAMTTGFFDGTEIMIDGNDCPDLTSYANLVTTTVAQWSAQPIVRNNTISQSATANGRGVVGTGTAAPTIGTYLVGDVVLNATPAAAGVYGWICVVAGTPGTFKTFGGIAA